MTCSSTVYPRFRHQIFKNDGFQGLHFVPFSDYFQAFEGKRMLVAADSHFYVIFDHKKLKMHLKAIVEERTLQV